MDIVQKVTGIIEPSLAAMGYALVQVKLAPLGGRQTLSLMAERTDGQPIGSDDCTEISRMASALLDVEDPIPGAYDLEVCSPGIDRPLTRPEDFRRFAGQEAKIETLRPIEGRKRFRGILEGIEGEEITMAMPEGAVKLRFSDIRTARLVLSEALLAAAGKKVKHGN